MRLVCRPAYVVETMKTLNSRNSEIKNSYLCRKNLSIFDHTNIKLCFVNYPAN